MKKIIGILFILLGFGLGAYIGLYLMFICGILEIARQIDIGNITAVGVAWNLIKIILATPVGVILVQIPCAIGITLIND